MLCMHTKEFVVLVVKTAEIGLILLVCSVFAYFFSITVVARPLSEALTFPGFISYFTHLAIMYTPVSVLTIVGLAFYIAGKREFKKRSIKHPDLTTSSKILGAVLLVFGALTTVLGWFSTRYYALKLDRAFIDTFINDSPATLSFVLWTISGIILVVDSWKSSKASNQERI